MKRRIKLLVFLLLVSLPSLAFSEEPRLAILPTVDITIQGLGGEVDAWLVKALSPSAIDLITPQVTYASLEQLGLIDQMVKIPDNAAELGELLWADAIAYCTLAALGENYGLAVSIRDGVKGEMIAKERFSSTTYTDFEGFYEFIVANVSSIRPQPTEEVPRPDLTELVNSIDTLEEGLGGLGGMKRVALLPPTFVSAGGRSMEEIYLLLVDNSALLSELYLASKEKQSGLVEVEMTINPYGKVKSLSTDPSYIHSTIIREWLNSINFNSSTDDCRVDFVIYFGE